MSVFQLDPDTGALVRDRRGFTRISGLAAIAQDLRVYLRLRRGEIPTRTDLGLPWLTILQAGVNPGFLGRVVGEEGVLTRPAIVAQSTRVDIDGATRTATVTYRATADLLDQRRRLALSEQVVVQV